MRAIYDTATTPAFIHSYTFTQITPITPESANYAITPESANYAITPECANYAITPECANYDELSLIANLSEGMKVSMS